MKTFEELGVSEQIRRAISELGFEQPMPVQEQVIPYLLNGSPTPDPSPEGRGTNPEASSSGGGLEGASDLIALAQTGTGKTAAFGIPLLQTLDTDNRQTQALILSPTRELCLQISDDLKDFAK
ncbi:MAG: DEAD/DEAH box helicase, partial [Prevotella sp.]|nr:DEAD/DEAH box helicase [Prevotella sp.]